MADQQGSIQRRVFLSAAGLAGLGLAGAAAGAEPLLIAAPAAQAEAA
ncbi:hypothetical protein ODZ83_08665 [Acaricomes phytoseiuli]|nr:hypothetical protein [Acaricomes phytoseiuli]MCW1250246.1 hypothetical protein [Acaricomes phytoseiuli]